MSARNLNEIGQLTFLLAHCKIPHKVEGKALFRRQKRTNIYREKLMNGVFGLELRPKLLR